MTKPEGCPVVGFDHNSPEHSADPVASYARLRHDAPVAWTDAQGGFWVLSDYDAVFEAARDDATFSSARSPHGGEGLATVIPKAPVRLHIPVELDQPEHRSYRRILNPLTSPAAVQQLVPMIRKWSTWFIDEVIEDGKCDFATVIGVPAVVTLDWLGLDVGQWQRYSRTLHSVLADSPGSPAHTRSVQVDIPWMEEQISTAIAVRRAEPRADLISHLLAQSVDGEPITDDAAYSLIELLISGGVGTTASLISQTLVHLSRNPEQRAELAADPDLLERAVEEFLRAFSPTQALARTVTKDVEFRGCSMRAGDRALLAWGSANRDPQQFERPDEVDIHRWPNRHTAFGMGIHRCAGAHVGRAIARELLGQVLSRMPDYVVDLDGVESYAHQGVNAGFSRIPATFTPGPRRGEGSVGS